MKFAAVLRNSVQDLPDTEELFTLYKQLKKSIKRIAPAQTDAHATSTSSKEDEDKDQTHQEVDNTQNKPKPAAQDQTDDPAAADPPQPAQPPVLDLKMEEAFVKAITQDVAALNESYMEKEEINVIKLGQLEERAAQAETNEEISEVYGDFIDFHGDLLMVLNWSILAYTGLVKILKKHRKRTGTPVNAPHLENLLSQPFCSVEVTCEMIRNAEVAVQTLAEKLGATPPLAPAAAIHLLKSNRSDSFTSPFPAAAALAGAGGSGQLLAQQLADREGGGGVLKGDSPKAIDSSSLHKTNTNPPQQQQQRQQVENEGSKEKQGVLGVKRPAALDTSPNDADQVPTSSKQQRQDPPCSTAGGNGSGNAKIKNATTNNAAVDIGLPPLPLIPNIDVEGHLAGARRARAALTMWQQLAVASTPSTCIAAAAATAPGGGGEGGGVRGRARSDTTNSSVA